MITERTIINALIVLASLILAPFIISSTLTIDYWPAILFCGVIAVLFAFFFIKDNLAIWPLLSCGIVGNLNFLPLQLSASNVFSLLLILYYITGYVIIRQTRIRLGRPQFLFPILIITFILLYHNHTFALHVANSDSEGARPAFLIYLTVLAYFCGINVATPSVSFLSKLPVYYVILTTISNLPFILTTFVPGLAPFLYYITDRVNVEAYVDTLSGTGGDSTAIGRLGALASIGMAVQAYLVSRYPIGTWLRPERWWIAILSLVCAVLAVASGYRDVLFSFAILTTTGIWAYYGWRSFFIVAGSFVLLLALLVASSNNMIHLSENRLPLIAQRSLSFLPGQWDEDAISSGKASDEFRENIQDVYVKEYLPKSPWIGNGFVINTKEFEYWRDAIPGVDADPKYIQAKLFIEGKLYHTGWISLYDVVGLVGGFAFVGFALSEIALVNRFLYGEKADERSTLYPIYVWILCNLVSTLVSFFTVFGDMRLTFIYFCLYGIALSHLADLQNVTEGPVIMPVRKNQVEFSGLGGPSYGYRSKP